MPVTQSVEGFVQRFSAEGMSLLVDSRVYWLAGDEPAAIHAIVARAGGAARLAAFALRPARWRGKGLGRKLVQELLIFATAGSGHHIGQYSWQVIRDNHRGRIALYQSLGFYASYGLCSSYLEYRTSAPGAGRYCSFIPPCPCFRRAIEESNGRRSPSAALDIRATSRHLPPCQVVTLLGTSRPAVLTTAGSRPVLVSFLVGGARRSPPGAGGVSC